MKKEVKWLIANIPSSMLVGSACGVGFLVVK